VFPRRGSSGDLSVTLLRFVLAAFWVLGEASGFPPPPAVTGGSGRSTALADRIHS
jgi:hypothetical protein